MSKNDIKYQIRKVLDHFSDKALEDLSTFLKNIEKNHPASMFNANVLDKILNEDSELLKKLTK